MLTAARTLAAAPVPHAAEFVEEFRRVIGVVHTPDRGGGLGSAAEFVLLRLHAALKGIAPFRLLDGGDEVGRKILFPGRRRPAAALDEPHRRSR